MFLHLCVNTAGAVNYSYLQHVYCLSPCSVTAWHVSDLKLFVLPPIDPWCVVSALCLWFDSICTVDEETGPTVRFSGFGERDFVCTHRKQLLFSLSLIVTVQPANHSAKMQMRHNTGKEVQHEAVSPAADFRPTSAAVFEAHFTRLPTQSCIIIFKDSSNLHFYSSDMCFLW